MHAWLYKANIQILQEERGHITVSFKRYDKCVNSSMLVAVFDQSLPYVEGPYVFYYSLWCEYFSYTIASSIIVGNKKNNNTNLHLVSDV